MTRTALIVSGHRRYADQWHDLPATSAAIDAELRSHGLAPATTGFVDHALATIADEVDLLVLNVARGDLPFASDGPADRDERAAAQNGLAAYVRAGRPLLAAHSSSIAFDDWPEWETLLGGRWVRGTSMHPEIGPAAVHVYTAPHPITAGVGDFTVHDERYTHLRVSERVTPLTWHEHEGRRFPLSWVQDHDGARVVYDALGHVASSYAEPARQKLLTQTVDWLTGAS